VTNSKPLEMQVDERLSLNFEAGPPSSLSAAWLPVASEAPASGPDGSVWPAMKLELTKQDVGPIVPEVGTGRFLYVVQAVWEGRGDVVYGFYLDRSEGK
jgi:hypothetical protein